MGIINTREAIETAINLLRSISKAKISTTVNSKDYRESKNIASLIFKNIIEEKGLTLKELEKFSLKIKFCGSEGNLFKERLVLSRVDYHDTLDNEWLESKMKKELDNIFFLVPYMFDNLEKTHISFMKPTIILFTEEMRLVYKKECFDVVKKRLATCLDENKMKELYKGFPTESLTTIGHIAPRARDNKDLIKDGIFKGATKTAFCLNKKFINLAALLPKDSRIICFP